MNARFVLSCTARLIAGLLARSGVTDLVVSPGSRSTPYLSAVLEQAELRLHVVIDERSAAYVAIGIARAQGRTVALLCTSGTAVANYFPAVVEARMSEIPLLILTADRPLSLLGCAAPQTIDQTHIYGRHVVGATSIVMPNGSQGEFARLRRQFLSTLRQAEGPDRGPVHINLHTPKPLELVQAGDAHDRAMQAYVEQLIAETRSALRSGPPRPNAAVIQELTESVLEEERGLLVCGYDPGWGGMDPKIVARFARASGYPVLLDAAHPLRFAVPDELRPFVVAPFEPLLRSESWRRRFAPRLVLQLGRPLTSGSFDRWLELDPGQPGLGRLLLLARRGWPDPSGLAELLECGDPNQVLARISEALERAPSRSSNWGPQWVRASMLASDCIAELRSSAESLTVARPWAIAGDERQTLTLRPLGELEAVLAVLDAQPAGARLIAGNSLPIRELDLLAAPRDYRISVEALRGTSGIDGVVSTAVGFALAQDGPTTLLVGDISFLHDVGGLWAARKVSSPLALVVLNNGGGRIFEQLPIARSVPKEQLEYWTTPQSLDLSAAALLYGLDYCRAENQRALAEAMALAYCRPRATVIEVMVDQDSPREQLDALLQETTRRLIQSGLLPDPRVA